MRNDISTAVQALKGLITGQRPAETFNLDTQNRIPGTTNMGATPPAMVDSVNGRDSYGQSIGQPNYPTLGNMTEHPFMNNPHLIPLLHLLQMHNLSQSMYPPKGNTGGTPSGINRAPQPQPTYGGPGPRLMPQIQPIPQMPQRPMLPEPTVQPQANTVQGGR